MKTITKRRKDYIKPSLRKNLDHFILNVDTNDLCPNRSPELIGKFIIDHALTLKNKSHVSASNMIAQSDDDSLNKKRCKVNPTLLELRKEKYILLIDIQKRIKPGHHIRGSHI